MSVTWLNELEQVLWLLDDGLNDGVDDVDASAWVALAKRAASTWRVAREPRGEGAAAYASRWLGFLRGVPRLGAVRMRRDPVPPAPREPTARMLRHMCMWRGWIIPLLVRAVYNDEEVRLPTEAERRLPLSPMGEGRWRVRRTVAALALLTATIAACGEDRGCHLIGAEPGVRVTTGVGGGSVRLCAGVTCGTAPLSRGENFVGLPSLQPGQRVELRVTYSHASQRTTSVVSVVPNKFQPNGPHCPPSVAVATLTLDASGRVAG